MKIAWGSGLRAAGAAVLRGETSLAGGMLHLRAFDDPRRNPLSSLCESGSPENPLLVFHIYLFLFCSSETDRRQIDSRKMHMHDNGSGLWELRCSAARPALLAACCTFVLSTIQEESLSLLSASLAHPETLFWFYTFICFCFAAQRQTEDR